MDNISVSPAGVLHNINNHNFELRGAYSLPQYEFEAIKPLLEHYRDNELSDLKGTMKKLSDEDIDNYEPKRKGKWVFKGGNKWVCSRCDNEIFTQGGWDIPEIRFCDNCGADMRRKAYI